MKIALDCLPCFLNQVLATSRAISLDPVKTRKVMTRVIEELARFEQYDGTMHLARRINRIFEDETGRSDMYEQQKSSANRWMLKLTAQMFPDGKPTSFKESVRLAVAGNIIDLGANPDLSSKQVLQAIDKVVDADFFIDHTAELKLSVDRAKKILYVGDNAGEIVFDRMLVSMLPPGQVTFCVRGRPVLNDATRTDADTVVMGEIARIIDTGTDYPGVVFSESSDEFKQTWDEADLVISKGQGNFESLIDCKDKPVFFLFMAKCSKVADMLGCRIGDYIVFGNQV